MRIGHRFGAVKFKRVRRQADSQQPSDKSNQASPQPSDEPEYDLIPRDPKLSITEKGLDMGDYDYEQEQSLIDRQQLIDAQDQLEEAGTNPTPSQNQQDEQNESGSTPT